MLLSSKHQKLWSYFCTCLTFYGAVHKWSHIIFQHFKPRCHNVTSPYPLTSPCITANILRFFVPQQFIVYFIFLNPRNPQAKINKVNISINVFWSKKADKLVAGLLSDVTLYYTNIYLDFRYKRLRYKSYLKFCF